jgi:hypothetical protein
VRFSASIGIQYEVIHSWFHDWHFHSRRGIFGYDCWDAHRKQHEKLNRCDLLTVPDIPIEFDSIPGIERFKPIIPRFDLVFCGNILFKDVMETESY